MDDGRRRPRRRRDARHRSGARRPATCSPPSCAPAASTSASRRCSTSTTAPAASSATAPSTAIRASSRCWRESLMHGLLLAGMHNCGKHFPGHGFVARRQPPRDAGRPPAARRASWPTTPGPYEWLARHARQRDAGARDLSRGRRASRPASRRAGCARSCASQLGFDGAIFSDDLSMEGARRIGGAEVSYAEAAALALAAGCDLVLLCNQSLDGGAAVDALLDELLAAAGRGPLAGRSRQRGAPPRPAAADRAARLGRADARAGVPARARAPALNRLRREQRRG